MIYESNGLILESFEDEMVLLVISDQTGEPLKQYRVAEQYFDDVWARLCQLADHEPDTLYRFRFILEFPSVVCDSSEIVQE
jgi:hypothetical protein